MLVIMYRFFDHLSFYLLEVIVHFQRANPGTMLLRLLIDQIISISEKTKIAAYIRTCRLY